MPQVREPRATRLFDSNVRLVFPLPEDQRPHAVALMAEINDAADQLRERAGVRR